MTDESPAILLGADPARAGWRAAHGLPGRHRLSRSEAGGTADPSRDAAERFVSLTLVEPILKQMRQSSQAAPPFGPAPGEVQFRALLDAEVARQVVRAGDFPLVERLARDLRARGGGPPLGPVPVAHRAPQFLLPTPPRGAQPDSAARPTSHA